MSQKFKITTCAFILCLFGLTLMTVSPVYAQQGKRMDRCEKMKALPKPRKKINCFRNEAKRLRAELVEVKRQLADKTSKKGVSRVSSERKHESKSQMKARIAKCRQMEKKAGYDMCGKTEEQRYYLKLQKDKREDPNCYINTGANNSKSVVVPCDASHIELSNYRLCASIKRSAKGQKACAEIVYRCVQKTPSGAHIKC
jgi:hypothetical protein